VYELIQQVGVRAFLTREAGYLLLALVIAEFAYKFHSFTLEAVAFLATWYALSWLGAKLFRSSGEP
jgi:hypothetical protein